MPKISPSSSTKRFLTGYTQFVERVEALVKTIPRGRVATYGQVAALCGSPRSARQVGCILFRSVQTPWPKASRSLSRKPTKGPPSHKATVGSLRKLKKLWRGEGWQRVMNREGRLSIVNPEVTAAQQATLLRREGVNVTEHDGSYWVDLNRYLWNPERPRQ